MDREQRAKVYLRVCKDSGYRLDAIEAAKLAANVIGCSAIEILTAVGCFNNLERIAKGTHPACKMEKIHG